MLFGMYTCAIQRHIVLDRGPYPEGRGDLGVELSAKACNCLFMIHQATALISSSAFYRITSELVYYSHRPLLFHLSILGTKVSNIDLFTVDCWHIKKNWAQAVIMNVWRWFGGREGGGVSLWPECGCENRFCEKTGCSWRADRWQWPRRFDVDAYCFPFLKHFLIARRQTDRRHVLLCLSGVFQISSLSSQWRRVHDVNVSRIRCRGLKLSFLINCETKPRCQLIYPERICDMSCWQLTVWACSISCFSSC